MITHADGPRALRNLGHSRNNNEKRYQRRPQKSCFWSKIMTWASQVRLIVWFLTFGCDAKKSSLLDALNTAIFKKQCSRRLKTRILKKHCSRRLKTAIFKTHCSRRQKIVFFSKWRHGAPRFDLSSDFGRSGAMPKNHFFWTPSRVF